MIIAPMPETGDGPDLFTGPGGIMIRNMLAALELDQDAAYFATALPSLITAPDWDGLAAAGLGAVLAHHISLAQPRRVLLLGSTLARILPQEPAVPVLSAFAPEQLLAHPRQRARLWKRLLEWMPDE